MLGVQMQYKLNKLAYMRNFLVKFICSKLENNRSLPKCGTLKEDDAKYKKRVKNNNTV